MFRPIQGSAQRVDAVAEQAEQRRQQRERREHGDDRRREIAPTPRLFITFEGTSSIPLSAITKTVPLKSTARLEVAPAAAIASSSARPPARSSR